MMNYRFFEFAKSYEKIDRQSMHINSMDVRDRHFCTSFLNVHHMDLFHSRKELLAAAQTLMKMKGYDSAYTPNKKYPIKHPLDCLQTKRGKRKMISLKSLAIKDISRVIHHKSLNGKLHYLIEWNDTENKKEWIGHYEINVDTPLLIWRYWVQQALKN